ncbi:putative RND superfamily transporter [Sulfitobacter guttiformis KCTC 32187]|uniref:Uncharacterized protein n=1 Tax=Sulfitobacter guttiformis TaxID=74349 RepID=A0A420DQE4_9RHOB|nr:putative RND superfamily transporter [Sulfitobacter guttiformis KCTC 32187]RKE96534.1 hypothetical protein C8N30_1095 [Sulfitobacter guttiformis]
MFSGIGFGAQKIGLAALTFPKIVATFILVLTILIGASVPRVTFDDDIHRVFLSDSPLSDAQRAYEKDQSPPLGTVLILVKAEHAFTAPQMSDLRDLTLDLEFLEGVAAVASPFILRSPPEADAPSGKPLFTYEIPDDFGTDLTAFKEINTGLPTFLDNSLTDCNIGIPNSAATLYPQTSENSPTFGLRSKHNHRAKVLLFETLQPVQLRKKCNSKIFDTDFSYR